MTIYKFAMRDEMEQIEVIWDSVFVGEYEDATNAIN